MKTKSLLLIFVLLLTAIITTTPVAQSSPPAQGTALNVVAEALNPDANVRSEPSVDRGDASIVGQIQPGERYAVYGRYFEWVLLDFPSAANGRAWVFSGVVSLSVPIDTLPVIDPASILPLESAQTATASALQAQMTPSLTPTLKAEIMPSPTPSPTMAVATFTPVVMTPTPVLLTDFEAEAILDDPEAELDRRLAALNAVYSQTLTLFYGENIILLSPETIGFRLDEAAIRSRLDPAAPFTIASIAITASYDEDLLAQYLTELANRYDRGRSMNFDATSLTFTLGAPGQNLNIAQAQIQIASALYSPFSIGRIVSLPLETNLQPDMEILQTSILDYLGRVGVFYNSPTSVVSVYVEDLQSGATMGIQENVLHSATSTAKIGVLANYFRYVYQLPNREFVYRLIAAMVCSSNADANLLMNVTGNGDDRAGIRNVTDTFCRAGAGNTRLNRHFGIGPAGEGAVPIDYYAPAGAPVCENRAPLNTQIVAEVDPEIQSTAQDMGHFLGEIYSCAQDGTGLAMTFPGEITQTECQYMLEIMSGTNFAHMMELGVPTSVDIAHKVGYAGQAFGDAGIVYAPNGDYIFVFYMWDTRLGNFDSFALGRWAISGEVSRIVYNFLNPDSQLTRPNTPLNPNGGAACVLPSNPQMADISNVDAGRFDANGNPLPSACYDWPECRPFDNWGQ